MQVVPDPPPPGQLPAWRVPASEVARRLDVRGDLGLTSDDARRRVATHGANRLQEVRPPSAFEILKRQVASLIVLLLAVAALAAFVFGDALDGAAILAVLCANTLIGFVNELRAVQSMEALRKLGTMRATVRRDGRAQIVPAEELVPGDVVLLDAGDVVTADVRLVNASKVEVDESTLTGESLPVAKSADTLLEDAALHERACMLFKGTALTRGTAEGLVVATGMGTELGGIARLVRSARKQATPLERRLERLGTRLIWVVLGVAVLTTLGGILAGKPALLMIETAIALAVAAIPEGLPVVATLALTRGMARMARRNALVNRLSAVETLGATTAIFTDKTGTLTENRMQVRRVVLDAGSIESGRGIELDPASVPGLGEMLEVAVLCNNASLGPPGGAGSVGDPMEVALLELGASGNVRQKALLERQPELREEAFDASTRMMATFHPAAGDDLRVAVKGAAEAVLEASTHVLTADGPAPLDDAQRARWNARVDELAADGLRVLAAAQRSARSRDEAPYAQLTFLGLLGLADPPRADVPDAIAACRGAGVRVIMVTGDHAGTARSIARAVGLSERLEGEHPAPVVLGSELERAAPDERAALLERPVFARVTPQQKLDLVAAYQAAGHVVAMTGDGVNDAPALRKADIGVAMGQRGTQVAREAADMVLTDDAFPSIVAAIEEGRALFDNIRRFVVYLLSCNVSEVLVVSLAAVFGEALPLLPLQILFLNLVTDVFPALALAYGAGAPGILRRPPRDPSESILTRRAWLATAGYGALLAVAVLAAFALAQRALGYDPAEAVTVSFLTLAIAQLLHVFNMRSPESTLLRNEITRNPWVWAAAGLCVLLLLLSMHVPLAREALGTRPLDAAGWALVVAFSSLPLVVGSTVTAALRRRTTAPQAAA